MDTKTYIDSRMSADHIKEYILDSKTEDMYCLCLTRKIKNNSIKLLSRPEWRCLS